MNLWERLRKKEASSPPPPKPKPHEFCSYCGQPMVNGYLVESEGFDQETGAPTLNVYKKRLCTTQHSKTEKAADDKHDGAYVWPPTDADYGIFGWGYQRGYPISVIPRPCPPPRKAAPRKRVAR